jgi:energy-coupling factor transport system ATP-binding protein
MHGVVQAERVAFDYPQHDFGLAPTSLRVEAGDAVFVSGRSGSGKSTLARCLVGLIPHLYRGRFSGQVWLAGELTTTTPLWKLAERAGLVFQNPAAQMLAISVEEELIFGLENLGLPRSLIRERLESTLSRFGLQGFRARSPQTLSGGEQQKLALAAIMARQPPVLVLDEPLSMLDSSAASELVAHLTVLAGQGTTIIACEHRAEYLQAIPNLKTVHVGGQLNSRTPVSSDSGPSPLAPLSSAIALQVSDLSVAFDGRSILRDLSFGVEGGQVVALVGRNGVGKTTLLRTLAGLQAHTGAVSINGERPDLGLVFQNADLQLFNASVRDEILFRLPRPDIDRYHWLLAMLGLSSYEDTPPLLLSEGEKKRVALATVLMRGPRHGLLLDEPALGQDKYHKARLVRLAHALAEAGQLVIMTTHDLELAAQADRLFLLGPDGLIADGPPTRVLGDATPWSRIGMPVPSWVFPGPHVGIGAPSYLATAEEAIIC